MTDLVLNGRFLGRPITGVDRLAIELTRAMRRVLAHTGGGEGRFEVVVPPGGASQQDVEKLADASGALPACRTVGSGDGHAWEQRVLQRYRPGAWLLNLCNTGPMLRRHQVVMIADAQFVTQPQSYSLAFRLWYRVLLSVIGRRAEVIYTISEDSRRTLERYRIVPAGKAQIIRLGVDHLRALQPDDASLARFSLEPGRYILAIGSLARHKNVARLAEAFLAAELDDVRLVVAGGGNPTVFRDAGLPVADSISYLGRVTDAELKSLYSHAMAFACPSITEGFGLPPLEAMSTGCPVIATTGGAVPEVCGDAAVYADPFSTDAWIEALRQVAGDAELRAAMRHRSLARATLFTWEGAARQVLKDLAQRDGDRPLLQALERSPPAAVAG